MADAAFLEGGFCCSIVAREAREILEATPTFEKTRPFSIVLELPYLSIELFWIETSAKAC